MESNVGYLLDILLVAAAIVLLLLIVIIIWIFRLAGILKNERRDSHQFEKTLRDEMAQLRTEISASARESREEASRSMLNYADSTGKRISELAEIQKNQLDSFSNILGNLGMQMTNQLADVSQKLENSLERSRDTLAIGMREMREENTKRLDEMRQTVDTQLQSTLEKRLGESFKLVGERLDAVSRGLGEMQTLANGVGDLKRVLTNVKTRGIWGELQLAAIIEEMLTPEQYEKNCATRKNSPERVEFAIKMPARDSETGYVYMPVDAKFPQEDYQRLLDAVEAGDAKAAEDASKAIETRIRLEAKSIRDKYVEPPHTTDFAVLFLPVEGLFAEVLRRPGLMEALQHEYRITIAGPTTFAAMLNALQMGFRTLAIEQRTNEVWSLLGVVRSEFGKFGGILDKTHRQLQTAANSIENAVKKTRTIERKLKDVQSLPMDGQGEKALFDESEDADESLELDD